MFDYRLLCVRRVGN